MPDIFDDFYLVQRIREEREENRRTLEKTGSGFVVREVTLDGERIYPVQDTHNA